MAAIRLDVIKCVSLIDLLSCQISSLALLYARPEDLNYASTSSCSLRSTRIVFAYSSFEQKLHCTPVASRIRANLSATFRSNLRRLARTSASLMRQKQESCSLRLCFPLELLDCDRAMNSSRGKFGKLAKV